MAEFGHERLDNQRNCNVPVRRRPDLEWELVASVTKTLEALGKLLGVDDDHITPHPIIEGERRDVS